MITKNKLDELVKKYETANFISPDPIAFRTILRQKKILKLQDLLPRLLLTEAGKFS